MVKDNFSIRKKYFNYCYGSTIYIYSNKLDSFFGNHIGLSFLEMMGQKRSIIEFSTNLYVNVGCKNRGSSNI